MKLDDLESFIFATVIDNPYIPHVPHPKQIEFLLSTEREVMFGGAAGGGKSETLLMAALQFVTLPGYSALILRRSYADLALPEAIMDRSHEWLGGTDAKWNGQDKTWEFPSGSKLVFGYLASEGDHFRYQSSAFQFIAFDELTQFTLRQYTYLMSRLRRIESTEIPLRVRSATNPGGAGHDWVWSRFIGTTDPERKFIPSRLSDNPTLNAEEYAATLHNLDPVTRRQLLDGDWDIRTSGGKFKREWFDIIEPDAAPWEPARVRAWDTASTEKTSTNDPDWTVGVLLARKDGYYTVLDVRRVRANAGRVQELILQTAKEDGRAVRIRMGQEPGSSGEHMIHDYARKLAGYQFEGVRETGTKWVRANPASSAAHNRLIRVVSADWNRPFFDELEAFAEDPKTYAHDDQVDAFSLAFHALTASGATGPITYTPSVAPTRGQEIFGGIESKNPFGS